MNNSKELLMLELPVELMKRIEQFAEAESMTLEEAVSFILSR